MSSTTSTPSRRGFLSRLTGAGSALALSSCAGTSSARVSPDGPARAAAGTEWDVSWLDRVHRARHRAVFDAPSGDISLQLAARYFDNVAAVYKATAPDVIAVLNMRTRAVTVALNNAMWAKYPLAEDVNVTDPVTGAPARRNINYTPAANASPAYAAATLERLRERGAVILVCDFALGHLATRLATKVGTTSDAVHRDLRGGFVPGAIAVPSGIFGLGEAQNAGCAFVPA